MLALLNRLGDVKDTKCRKLFPKLTVAEPRLRVGEGDVVDHTNGVANGNELPHAPNSFSFQT